MTSRPHASTINSNTSLSRRTPKTTNGQKSRNRSNDNAHSNKHGTDNAMRRIGRNRRRFKPDTANYKQRKEAKGDQRSSKHVKTEMQIRVHPTVRQ